MVDLGQASWSLPALAVEVLSSIMRKIIRRQIKKKLSDNGGIA